MGAYKKPLKMSRHAKKVLASRKVVDPGKDLTARAMAYGDLRVQGLTEREAGVAVGYADNTANWTRLENNKNLQSYMRSVAAGAGITPESIMKKVADGMEAKITKEYFNKDTGTVLGKPMDDMAVQLEYTKLAISLTGIMPGKGADEASAVAVNITVLADTYKSLTKEELAYRMQRIKQGRYDPAENAVLVTEAHD